MLMKAKGRLSSRIRLLALLLGLFITADAAYALAWWTSRPALVAPPHLAMSVQHVANLDVLTGSFVLTPQPAGARLWHRYGWNGHPAAHTPSGVPLYRAHGVDYPQPVSAVLWGQQRLASHDLTGGIAAGDALMEMAELDGGVLWFPYLFTFNGNSPPWYSALAQGSALSLFCQLYESTRDPRWRTAADETFASFLTGEHGILHTDDAGFLWLEEYPARAGGWEVFNGHITATFGLVDYYWLTGSGKSLIDAALTTAEHYAPVIRNPGGLSSYSVNVPVVDPHYHPLHVAQLHALAKVTGVRYFESMARAFDDDA